MPVKRFIKRLRRTLKEKGFGGLWESMLLFMILLSLTTTIHETTHVAVAYYEGCSGKVEEIAVFTGLSAISCDSKIESDDKYIIIALSAPIVLFFFGLYIWFADKEDSLLRLWSLLCWFYGSIPSLSFWTPDSDAQFAVHHGLPLLWAIALFFIPAAIMALLLRKEVTRENQIWRREDYGLTYGGSGNLQSPR